MKINETHPRGKGFVLWDHCQNILDDPRINNDPTPSQLVHLMHNKFIFCIVDPSHSYCKSGNFRENFIFANSVKRHTCDVKIRD